MPIGKNSIKRVVNNGYSKIESTAPDMENSTVEKKLPKEEKKSPAKRKAAPKAEEAKTAKKAPTAKAAKKAPSDKSAPKAKADATEKEEPKPENKAQNQTENKNPDLISGENIKVSVGDKMPNYLL